MIEEMHMIYTFKINLKCKTYLDRVYDKIFYFRQIFSNSNNKNITK